MSIQPYYERDGITIFHGDCREILPQLAFDAIVTDPPYGIGFDTDYTRFTGGVTAATGSHAAVFGDDEPFDPAWLIARCKNVVMFGANCFSALLPLGSWLVWDKRTPGGNKNVMSDGEVAWWGRGHGIYIFSHTWDGFNRASERQTAFHPTQKPVALLRWVLNRCTGEDDVIADPYMGAGSTVIAARDLGRRAIGIEIEEKYVEIAARRLEQQVLPIGDIA